MNVLKTICELTLVKKITNLIGDRIILCPVQDGEEKQILDYKVKFFDIRSTKARQFGFVTTLNNGKRLTFCGDEPYQEHCFEYAYQTDYFLHEAFCLDGEKDEFKPYEKHHSTVKEACQLAEELGVPVLKVQHHYAHILSCMAENDCADQVIGISFDGTGYGNDGTIWGGEILLADYDSFKRWGCIEPFAQTGGDASAKEGWRIAVSLIYGMTGDRKKAAEITEKLELCTKQEANVQFTMADRKINAVISTSAGRLFDGVSAMLGIRRKSTFEGEASMALEFAAEEYRETMLEKSKQQIQETEKYGYDKEDTDTLSRNENLSETEEIKRMDDKLISAGDRLLLNTESLIKEILNRQLNGEDPGKLAYFFHRELACQITAACVKIRELSGCNKAALSGGVFQNRLLLELTDHMLLEQGFEVLKHQLLPPNDGGIALGQAVYAMAYLEKA